MAKRNVSFKILSRSKGPVQWASLVNNSNNLKEIHDWPTLSENVPNHLNHGQEVQKKSFLEAVKNTSENACIKKSANDEANFDKLIDKARVQNSDNKPRKQVLKAKKLTTENDLQGDWLTVTHTTKKKAQKQTDIQNRDLNLTSSKLKSQNIRSKYKQSQDNKNKKSNKPSKFDSNENSSKDLSKKDSLENNENDKEKEEQRIKAKEIKLQKKREKQKLRQQRILREREEARSDTKLRFVSQNLIDKVVSNNVNKSRNVNYTFDASDYPSLDSEPKRIPHPQDYNTFNKNVGKKDMKNNKSQPELKTQLMQKLTEALVETESSQSLSYSAAVAVAKKIDLTATKKSPKKKLRTTADVKPNVKTRDKLDLNLYKLITDKRESVLNKRTSRHEAQTKMPPRNALSNIQLFRGKKRENPKKPSHLISQKKKKQRKKHAEDFLLLLSNLTKETTMEDVDISDIKNETKKSNINQEKSNSESLENTVTVDLHRLNGDNVPKTSNEDICKAEQNENKGTCKLSMSGIKMSDNCNFKPIINPSTVTIENAPSEKITQANKTEKPFNYLKYVEETVPDKKPSKINNKKEPELSEAELKKIKLKEINNKLKKINNGEVNKPIVNSTPSVQPNPNKNNTIYVKTIQRKKLNSDKGTDNIIPFPDNNAKDVNKIPAAPKQNIILDDASRLQLALQQFRHDTAVLLNPIHNSKFREYCDHCLSPEIDAALQELLSQTVRFQQRLYEKDPIKGVSKRRYYCGLKEVYKHMNKMSCIIVAPNVWKDEEELDVRIKRILDRAKELDVPVLFGLNVKTLGKLTYKKGITSCVGIVNYQGAQDSFNKVMSLIPSAKQKYEALQKRRKAQGEITDDLKSEVEQVDT